MNKGTIILKEIYEDVKNMSIEEYNKLFKESKFLDNIRLISIDEIKGFNMIINLNDLSEKDILARLIYGEARGESDEGKKAVANVVRNRLKKKSWYGKSYKEVSLKPKQFSCFNQEDPNYKILTELVIFDPIYGKCLEIACDIINNKIKDNTESSTHYHTVGVLPYWVSKMTFVKQIGNHKFYK